VTKETEASALAQILTSLRASGTFRRVVLVGHSFGTLLTTYTLGTYGNLADAFVATGWVNVPGIVPVDPAYIQSLFASPTSRCRRRYAQRCSTTWPMPTRA